MVSTACSPSSYLASYFSLRIDSEIVGLTMCQLTSSSLTACCRVPMMLTELCKKTLHVGAWS